MKKYFSAKAFGSVFASVVAGVFAISVAGSPVMAERGGGSHGGGARSAGHASGAGASRSFSGVSGRSAARVSAGRVSHNRESGRRRRGAVYGYASGQAYSGSCAYYYSRALATGSTYWWQRYEHCVGGY
jgi:hypothetical protein